jgi:hypothetical protein
MDFFDGSHVLQALGELKECGLFLRATRQRLLRLLPSASCTLEQVTSAQKCPPSLLRMRFSTV